jgi:hypothetical protein
MKYKAPKQPKGHDWEPFPAARKIHYRTCGRCGLIWLNNEVTLRAVRAPCPGREDDSRI